VGISVPELADYRNATSLFSDVAAIYPININLTAVDVPERIECELVSANYFEVLRVDAAVGQVFHRSDEIPGVTERAVISDAIWHRRFGGDPSVLGRRILLDNDYYEIIGVLPSWFRHPGTNLQNEPDLYIPSGYSATPFNAPVRRQLILRGALARLKPGISIEAAQTQLAALGASLRQAFPSDYPDIQGWRPRLVPLHEDLVGRVQSGLIVMLLAVGAVLIIACANVANLLLARAAARSREFAIRGAMGASRADLIRQVLVESVVLSLTGGLLGVLSARVLLAALVALIPNGMPLAAGIAINTRVLLFSLGVSVVTGLLFGLWPALQASPAAPYETLKDSTRAVNSNPRRTRVRNALVVAEFALALVLLVTAALFSRSFLRLYGVEAGFNPDQVLTAQLWMPIPNDPQKGPYVQPAHRTAFFRASLEKIHAIGGVRSAAWTTRLPLAGTQGVQPFLVEGQAPETAATNSMDPALVTPEYFDTLGIPTVRGRVFAATDNETAEQVLVVSESFVKKFFPNQDAVGHRLRLGGPASTAPWMTIVGVVGDVRNRRLEAAATPQLYRCALQASSLSMALVVKTEGDPAALSKPVLDAIHSIDPELPLFATQPMTAVIGQSTAQRRFAMIVIGIFAALALLLSSIGIYGVLAYLVQQRTSELGLRMALGASRGRLMSMILGEGVRLAAIGIAVGLAVAIVAAKAVSGMLFGVGPFDPVSFVGIAGLLTLVAIIACAAPAYRAMRVDPLVALRQD
jgi:putative ABC transport system permease protein